VHFDVTSVRGKQKFHDMVLCEEQKLSNQYLYAVIMLGKSPTENSVTNSTNGKGGIGERENAKEAPNAGKDLSKHPQSPN
jgi:hypothetical protein